MWSFGVTCEKVGSSFQCYHGGARRSLSRSLFSRLMDLLWELLSRSLSTRLIPAYGFGVVWFSAQPNRCTFVQSRAKYLRIPQNLSGKNRVTDRFTNFFIAREGVKAFTFYQELYCSSSGPLSQ